MAAATPASAAVAACGPDGSAVHDHADGVALHQPDVGAAPEISPQVLADAPQAALRVRLAPCERLEIRHCDDAGRYIVAATDLPERETVILRTTAYVIGCETKERVWLTSVPNTSFFCHHS